MRRHLQCQVKTHEPKSAPMKEFLDDLMTTKSIWNSMKKMVAKACFDTDDLDETTISKVTKDDASLCFDIGRLVMKLGTNSKRMFSDSLRSTAKRWKECHFVVPMPMGVDHFESAHTDYSNSKSFINTTPMPECVETTGQHAITDLREGMAHLLALGCENKMKTEKCSELLKSPMARK